MIIVKEQLKLLIEQKRKNIQMYVNYVTSYRRKVKDF